jgi:hypothetical protein
VQLAVGVKVPVELVVNVTDPVGVVGVADMSVTVAVQVVAWFTTTVAGEQVTLVVVWCGGTGEMVNDPTLPK